MSDGQYEYDDVDATIVEAEIVEDQAPYDLGYEAGVREFKLAVLDALDDGSECSLWAIDVVRSL